MTVVLSLLTAFAWTAFNYWVVPISRTVDPYVAAFVLLAANGLCTIPLALAIDGVPTGGDLRPLGFAALAGVFEVAGFLLFFRALKHGDLAVVAPIVGLEGGIAALVVIAFGERVSVLIGAGARALARGRMPGRSAGQAPHRCRCAARSRRGGLPRMHVRAASRRPRTSGP